LTDVSKKNTDNLICLSQIVFQIDGLKSERTIPALEGIGDGPISGAVDEIDLVSFVIDYLISKI
jgi:hypothetical protein